MFLYHRVSTMRSLFTKEPEGEATEREPSLEEMFAQHVEQQDLTPEKVRSAMNARAAQVRKQFLADYGLTKETLDGAPESVKSEIGSKLMDEVHSPEAKIEFGLLKAAVAREKRLLVKSKAEELLDVQRKRALNVSIPKKLDAAVRQRSTHLYSSELSDHFRSKYIEEIEKSDAYLPETKAAVLNSANPYMPDVYEVSREMSDELLHPDAFEQIVSERHAFKQARRQDRIKTIRKFLFSDLPYVVRSLVRLCIRAAPYLIVFITAELIANTFKAQLEQFDRITYNLASYGIALFSLAVGFVAVCIVCDRSVSDPEPSPRGLKEADGRPMNRRSKIRRDAKYVFALMIILLVMSAYMHGE